jgi:putative spermidine/putrescine transport system substrate-binding protein
MFLNIAFVLLLFVIVSCKEKAGNKEIVVATYAGKYGELLTKYVLEELKTTNPDLKVTYVLGTDNEVNPKLIAEAGGPGTFDVVLLSSASLERHANNGLLLELDNSKIPNKKYVLDQFQFPFFVPQIYSALVLAYNKDKIFPPPDSWNALYDPKYKGKIGMFQMRSSWIFTALAIGGGDPLNGDYLSYFDKLLELRDLDIKVYGSQDALAGGLQSGESWLTLIWRARSALLNGPGTEQTADVVPKEGSYAEWYGAGVPKNANNIDGAYAFLNAMLSVNAQKGFGEEIDRKSTRLNSSHSIASRMPSSA